jgi:nucleoside-diphosphate-sugar epimerase
MTLVPENTLVTVTGATGFIALHCVRELLSRGYRVRGTLRDRSREPAIRAALGSLGAERLSFVEAELTRDAGWAQAMADATYALHVASPLPKAPPKHSDELVVPAREGALRALRAAHEAGVTRVVMTSSLAAISSGRPRDPGHVFDERDWSDLDAPIGAYERSKTVAERAAWDFVRGLPSERGLELVCINPGYVLGPSLLGVDNTSNEIVGKLLRREVPGVPRLHLPLVDVRDVAIAHVLALTAEKAAGERFLLAAETVWMKEIADVLAAAGHRVPTRVLPNFLVRLVGLFDKTVRLVLHDLDTPCLTSSERAKALLGWSARGMKEMVLDTAASVVSRQAA